MATNNNPMQLIGDKKTQNVQGQAYWESSELSSCDCSETAQYNKLKTSVEKDISYQIF